MNWSIKINNLDARFSMRNDFFPYDELLLRRNVFTFQDAECELRDVKDGAACERPHPATSTPTLHVQTPSITGPYDRRDCLRIAAR
jgi:hypothetical protein